MEELDNNLGIDYSGIDVDSLVNDAVNDIEIQVKGTKTDNVTPVEEVQQESVEEPRTPERTGMYDDFLIPSNLNFAAKLHFSIISEGLEFESDGVVNTLGLDVYEPVQGEYYLMPFADTQNKKMLNPVIPEDKKVLDARLEYLKRTGEAIPYNSQEDAESDRAAILKTLEELHKNLPAPEDVAQPAEQKVYGFNKGGVVPKPTKSLEAAIANMLGISDEDIQWANALGQTYGVSEELDGRGDAARHLALGWLASRSKNPDIAKKAINAREYISFDRGKSMDISNNNKGVSIQAEDKVQAEEEIKKLIENKEAVYMTAQESMDVRGYNEGGLVQET